MKKPPKLIAGFIAILATAFLASTSVGQTDTGAPLEGTWICLSGTVDGKALPESTVKLLRLTLTKDRYKTEKGAEVLFESRYRLEPSQRPPQINIVGTEGELKGKDAQGIYQLAGDTLKICYTMPGNERPAAFESVVGSKAYFMIWKRQRP